MWATEIISKVIEPSGALRITVAFSDEQTTATRSVQVFNPTLASIKAALRLERSRLEAATAVIPDLAAGPIDIDAPDASASPPLAVEVYQQAFSTYRAVKAQFEAGLVKQGKVDAALEALQAAYIPEFVGII